MQRRHQHEWTYGTACRRAQCSATLARKQTLSWETEEGQYSSSCVCERGGEWGGRAGGLPVFLLLHSLLVHSDRYGCMWSLNGCHLQRGFHSEDPFRRQGGSHLLSIGCRGEPGERSNKLNHWWVWGSNITCVCPWMAAQSGHCWFPQHEIQLWAAAWTHTKATEGIELRWRHK